MKKKRYSVIVVLYTVFNIVVLVKFNIDEDLKEKKSYKSQYIDKYIIEDSQEDKYSEAYNKNIASNESFDNDDGNDNESSENTEESIITEERINNLRRKASYEMQVKIDKSYESDQEIGNIHELELDKYNKEIIEKNNVMKASPDEIMEELTPVEKTKIMLICRKLTKEDYSDITEYMTYKNERLAVMRTLNIIENRVEEEKVEELKGILSKYIDISKVEGN